MRSKPKVIAPQTPLSAEPAAPTPEQTMRSALDAEKSYLRRYGNKGRASTVLTGQGASNTLG